MPFAAQSQPARGGVLCSVQVLPLRDALWDYGLTDLYSNTPMGMTAENLAEKYSISRQVRAIEVEHDLLFSACSLDDSNPFICTTLVLL